MSETHRRLRGWRHVATGQWWPLPEGHKPPEYHLGPEWEPIYTPDRDAPVLRSEVVLAELLRDAENAATDTDRWDVIKRGWISYCSQGCTAFDWDYDSREVMAALVDHEYRPFDWASG
jgi:hypothetical protein